MTGDQLDLDAIDRTAGRMYEALRAHGYSMGLGTLSRDVPALVAEVRRLRARLAAVEAEADALDAMADELPTEASGLRLGARSIRAALTDEVTR